MNFVCGSHGRLRQRCNAFFYVISVSLPRSLPLVPLIFQFAQLSEQKPNGKKKPETISANLSYVLSERVICCFSCAKRRRTIPSSISSRFSEINSHYYPPCCCLSSAGLVISMHACSYYRPVHCLLLSISLQHFSVCVSFAPKMIARQWPSVAFPRYFPSEETRTYPRRRFLFRLFYTVAFESVHVPRASRHK